MQFKETSAEMKQTGDQVTIERLLPLATLAPGKYTLEINATDVHRQSDHFQDGRFYGEGAAGTERRQRTLLRGGKAK